MLSFNCSLVQKQTLYNINNKKIKLFMVFVLQPLCQLGTKVLTDACYATLFYCYKEKYLAPISPGY